MLWMLHFKGIAGIPGIAGVEVMEVMVEKKTTKQQLLRLMQTH